MKKFLSFLLLAILILSACTKNEPAEPAVGIDADPSYEKRAKVKTDYLASLKAISEKTGMQDIKTIYDFLNDHLVLASPKNENAILLEKNKKDKINFIPIFEEDISQNKGWKELYSRIDHPAGFFTQHRSIIVNTKQEMNELGKGLLLLHEGYHAYYYLNHAKKFENPEYYIVNDVNAYGITFIAMKVLGGEKYKPFYEKIKKEVSKNTTFKDGVFEITKKPSIDYDRDLAVFFGKAETDEGKRFLSNSCFMSALFEVMEQKYPYVQVKLKMAYVKGNFYSEHQSGTDLN